MSVTLPTVRQHIIDSIRHLLPETWRLYGDLREFDDTRAVAVTLTLESVARRPVIDQSKRIITYTLTVTDPHADPATREDYLDQDLFVFLAVLDTLPDLAWTTAQRVISNNRVGYDVALVTTISSKETPTTPDTPEESP